MHNEYSGETFMVGGHVAVHLSICIHNNILRIVIGGYQVTKKNCGHRIYIMQRDKLT